MTDKQREAAKAHFEAMAAWSQAKREVEAACAVRTEAWDNWGKALLALEKAEKRLAEVTSKYEKAMSA